MAANNAAPLQPLPEFHTTVSSVNFECTRILPLSRRRGGGRGLSPRSNRFDQQGGGGGGKRSHLGIKLRPPKKDNVSRCSSNTEQSNYSLGFSFSIFPPPPPPPSPAYFRNHWMFTHPIARRFGTTCNRFPCERQFLPLISTRSSLPRGSLSRNLLPSSSPEEEG